MDYTIESKCENLMNIVVESRKRFGKTCLEYDQKILIVEDKLLNLEVATVANYRFKPKNQLQMIEQDSRKDATEFLIEITEKQKRIEDLKKNLKNAQEILLQLKNDHVGKKLRAPLTADALLAQAKAKNA